jgi:hypothetical protein
MSDSALTPKSANEPAYPNDGNGPGKDPFNRTEMLKKQLGEDRAWLLLVAGIALPSIAFSTKSVEAVVIVALILLCWGVGKHLKWF